MYDCAASREGRGDLVDREIQREVERRDCCYHPHRYPHGHGHPAGARCGTSNRDDFARKLTGHGGSGGQSRSGTLDFETRQLDRFSRLSGDQASQTVSPVADESLDLLEDLGPLMWGQRGPGHRHVRDCDRVGDIVRIPPGDAPDGFGIVGRFYVEPFAGFEP